MADFEKSFSRVLKWEGGYTLENVKGDNGGLTCTGISRVYNPKWPGWKKIDAMTAEGRVDLEQVKPEILDFYREQYAPLDKVPSQKIADQIYQAYINCGKVAKKWAQKVCNDAGRSNLTIDGIIGMQTLSALHEISEDEFCTPYYELQVAYYDAIVKRDETQRKFIDGWRKRAGDFI